MVEEQDEFGFGCFVYKLGEAGSGCLFTVLVGVGGSGKGAGGPLGLDIPATTSVCVSTASGGSVTA